MNTKINFSLPNRYVKINNYFYNLPELYFKTPINIYATHGNLPYSYFNSGYNLNFLKTEVNKDYFLLKSNIPININCANININKNDFYDNKLKLLLDNNANGSNLIEVSNFEFLKFLQNKYNSYYNYVLSSEINLLKELTSEEINILLEEDIFRYISLNQKQSNDFNFLKKIKKRKNIEILIKPDCDMSCRNWNNCRLEQHDAIYDFSIKNTYNTCFYQKSTIIPIEDILNNYITIGYNHFKISIFNYTDKEYFTFLLNYFIKEEFKIEVCKKYYD